MERPEGTIGLTDGLQLCQVVPMPWLGPLSMGTKSHVGLHWGAPSAPGAPRSQVDRCLDQGVGGAGEHGHVAVSCTEMCESTQECL